MLTEKKPFGRSSSGEEVYSYRIGNSSGAYAVFIDYGATLQSLFVPDRNGRLVDVVLGYATIEQYESETAYIGSTVGRVANRIAEGKFSLNGKDYQLAVNNGPNALHGGIKGFDRCMWQAEELSESSIRFSRLSPDGEENYPGNLSVSVTFTLEEDCCLTIDYKAVCDADTLLNLTHHSYFDLSGRGLALEQELWINADNYLESDQHTLATGKILPVEGSPFDFRQFKAIGRDIFTEHEQLKMGNGYDHNFCLCAEHAATLRSSESGISMDIITDMPGLQLYSGNYLAENAGKPGKPVSLRSGMALETQLWPNALNCPGFPSPILRKGEVFTSRTGYRFGTY